MATDALANLTRLIPLVPGLATQAMDYTCTWLEQHAKVNAPWVDRTANLRNSIQAGVVTATGETVEGALSMGYPGFGMSMSYAIYVEAGTSRSAPYPAIWPAVQAAAQQQVFERAFEALLRQALEGQ